MASAAAVLALAATPALADQESATLVGAGDIAGCAWLGDENTATLLDGIPGTVFTTGDNVYLAGTLLEYLACYEPSWGRHKARTRPAPGNHDYQTAPLQGLGYFQYFGAAAGPADKGYYAYDAGPWRIIVLNGECGQIGGCGPASPQAAWLRAELAANPRECTAAIYHYPRFNSGNKGRLPSGLDLWRILHEHGAELILSGDEHVYERFAPQSPDGELDPRGIRQFTVGTGGALVGGFRASVEPNSEARIAGVHGVLELTLRKHEYDWQFHAVGGAAGDAGTGRCH